MLKRAVASHATSGSYNEQAQRTLHSSTFAKPVSNSISQPLYTNNSAVNVQREATNASKRRFDRSASSTNGTGSLAQLHDDHIFFDENDFEDDDEIDLDYKVRNDISQPPPRILEPTANKISYPALPPSTPSQKEPPSSAPVPWSTSPPEHYLPPQKRLSSEANLEQEEEVQSKRRRLPWLAKSSENDAVGDTRSTPLEKSTKSSYAWNMSASAVKNEQKELRRRNTAKSGTLKAVRDKARENVPATHLSAEQVAVAEAVVDGGKSVFFTGSAGTGKSVLMRSIIERLKKKYTREPDRLAITASTGLAACVIGGTTLHSWAGIGLGKEAVPELCKKIKRNAKTKTKWMRTKVLIIDEISMVDGALFDKLEQVARTIRNNGRPFGGIQLVVTGDFFQLPPVPERNSVAKFAFEAATWDTCIEHIILLTHVFRQKDPVFANMLNEMRLGRLTAQSIKNFQALSRTLPGIDEIEATELFPTRMEVDNANNTRMQRLSGQEMLFKATDSGVLDENVRKSILANFMAPEVLSLKKGSQVMLIKNIDEQLVNGSLGKVIAFMDEGTYAAYRSDEETYHLAHEEPGGVDAEEKAAARERFNVARYKNSEGSVARYWPMVRFPLPDGTCRDMLCMPEEWKTENQQQEVTAKRVQVPLILAWALSIHKAQGQTLSRVKVDLGKVFEKGQAYVALSRATSQEGLQVLRFNPAKVMVHQKVTQFYQKLVSIDSVTASKKDKNVSVTYPTLPGGKVANLDTADDSDELYMYP